MKINLRAKLLLMVILSIISTIVIVFSVNLYKAESIDILKNGYYKKEFGKTTESFGLLPKPINSKIKVIKNGNSEYFYKVKFFLHTEGGHGIGGSKATFYINGNTVFEKEHNAYADDYSFEETIDIRKYSYKLGLEIRFDSYYGSQNPYDTFYTKVLVDEIKPVSDNGKLKYINNIQHFHLRIIIIYQKYIYIKVTQK